MTQENEENKEKSLKGTLEAGGLELPQGDMSPEQTVSAALGELANLAAREGKREGVRAQSTFVEEKYDMKPEDLPGDTVGHMIDTIDQAMVDPVSQRAQSIGTVLEAVNQHRQQIRQTASTQLSHMMESGVWNQYVENNQEEARQIWESAGMLGDPYKIPESPNLGQIPQSQGYHGYTDSEFADIQSMDEPPEWFVEDAMEHFRQHEEQKKDLLLLKDLSSEEEEELTSGTSRERPSGAIRIPENRLEESPKFKKRVREEWQSVKNMPDNNAFREGGTTRPTELIANEIIEKGEHLSSVNQAHNLGHAINEQNDLGLTKPQVENAAEEAYETIPVKLPDYQISQVVRNAIIGTDDFIGASEEAEELDLSDEEEIALITEKIGMLAESNNFDQETTEKLYDHWAENRERYGYEVSDSAFWNIVSGIGTGAAGGAATGGAIGWKGGPIGVKIGAGGGAVIGGGYSGIKEIRKWWRGRD